MSPSAEYSGTLISDLCQMVAEKIDPPLYLADVLIHLADKEMEAGDVQAWFLIHDVQNCLWSRATEICVRAGCGQMEGMHPREGCCGFLSMETSYQVALRSACSLRLRGEQQ